MNTQKRLFIAAILAAVPMMFAFGGYVDDDSRSKSFTVGKGGTLGVTVDGGDIKISVWDKNEVLVRVEGIDEDDLDRLKMKQNGNDVSVEFRSRRSWGNWSSGHMRFEITVPSQYNADLHTSGGDITLKGTLNGIITGGTSGGDVKLEDVKGGKVQLSTSGGDMRTGDVQGDVVLKTSGGNIEMGVVGGEADVHTSGGNIDVKSVGKSLRANTSGGDIEIGDVGGEARVSTSGGDVRVRKVSGIATLNTSGGNIHLESASGTVKANTSGGDITLRNISGAIEASTSGGEVDAELRPSGKGRSKLTSAGGQITLSLPEDAHATVEATIRIEGRWGSRKNDYKIRSDFKAEASEQDQDEREIRSTYKLNGGGDLIELRTVNSDISIRKLHK
ncbi:MAG TPA: DUF4097 family beta strand repeat-containing protein [Bacteroidota bacterium]|nr:DUF4097 family beta strand repeat-containing protein [Bacteroidota bacterium]